MKERIIAVCSLAAGLGAWGLVAFIQADPLAFVDGPRAMQVLDSQPSIPFPEAALTHREPPIESAPTSEASNVIELAPVFIVLPTKRPSQPEPERTLEACSTWRELGPQYVNEGVPTGTQSVRDLC